MVHISFSKSLCFSCAFPCFFPLTQSFLSCPWLCRIPELTLWTREEKTIKLRWDLEDDSTEEYEVRHRPIRKNLCSEFRAASFVVRGLAPAP